MIDYSKTLAACVKDIESESDKTTPVELSYNEVRLLLALAEGRHEGSVDIDEMMVLECLMANFYRVLKGDNYANLQ